jgi:hypothetical protein
MSDITCVEKIEIETDVTYMDYSYSWEKLKTFLINLKEIKVSSLEKIMVALKDYGELLPEKGDLSKIRDLLLNIGEII